MIFKFHITGYAGNGSDFWNDLPVDVTVVSNRLTEAIAKAESVLGFTISTHNRNVVVEEMV